MPGLVIGPRPRLPVTLLSGFLGAGKTTLLENILTSPAHGLKIAVIVNDIGALNIDAALLSNHDITKKQEQVVAMQNGCICCTLRGDLLEEVARIANDGKVDYLIIESTGISEPMQVAETFSEEFAEQHMAAAEEVATENPKLASILAAGGLSKIARLDTCVTVVDCVNFMSDFATADFLVDRHGADEVPEEDDRNISDLQTEQVEFADVVLVNKCDLVDKAEVERVCAVVKSFNPGARILTSTRSQIEIGEIINTGRFSYAKAALGAGWLQSLKEKHNPETEEYGISTFVYRARRPFHPARLWHTVKEVFVIIQESYVNDGFEEDESGEMSEDEEDDKGEGEEEESGAMDVEVEQPQLNPKARLACKMADKTFGPLLRSKGFFWLATRPRMWGEWSQAGVMCTLGRGSVWRACIPEGDWTDDAEIKAAIEEDFEGEWGDRRQELVFIGQQMKSGGGEGRIREALDKCLLTDEEWQQCQEAMRLGNAEDKLVELFEDGFEDWPEEDEHAGHGHDRGHAHDHNHDEHDHFH